MFQSGCGTAGHSDMRLKEADLRSTPAMHVAALDLEWEILKSLNGFANFS